MPSPTIFHCDLSAKSGETTFNLCWITENLDVAAKREAAVVGIRVVSAAQLRVENFRHVVGDQPTVRGQEPATDAVFMAPDAFGWAYQYTPNRLLSDPSQAAIKALADA